MSVRSALRKLMAAAKGMTMRDPQAFFAGVREVTGSLNQIQVDTINGLLKEAKDHPLGWLAYELATAWHESGLEPIRERGGATYLSKYDTGKLAKALGNTPEADGDGIEYAGRGLVQLTGLRNYRLASKELGVDLVGNPDLALDPEIAVRILVWGMEGGKFTGKSLADYLPKRGPANIADFTEARRIVNGTDRAAKIADYALDFQQALIAGGWSR